MASALYEIVIVAKNQRLKLTAIGVAAYSRIVGELEDAGLTVEHDGIPVCGYKTNNVTEAVSSALLFAKSAAH